MPVPDRPALTHLLCARRATDGGPSGDDAQQAFSGIGALVELLEADDAARRAWFADVASERERRAA